MRSLEDDDDEESDCCCMEYLALWRKNSNRNDFGTTGHRRLTFRWLKGDLNEAPSSVTSKVILMVTNYTGGHKSHFSRIHPHNITSESFSATFHTDTTLSSLFFQESHMLSCGSPFRPSPILPTASVPPLFFRFPRSCCPPRQVTRDQRINRRRQR